MRKFNVPRGDLSFDTIEDLLCGGIVCHGYESHPLPAVSLHSTASGEIGGYFFEMLPGLWSVECSSRNFHSESLCLFDTG